ncbi:MAG: NPCBM/NEW2 domain-containing protein [Planctomycetaceae bacterium]
MSPLASGLLLSLVLTDPATVTTLDGKTLSGEVSQFSDAALVVDVNGEAKTIALDTILSVEWSVPVVEPDGIPEIQLVDGSTLRADCTISGDATLLKGAAVEASISRQQVRSIRFAALDAKVEESWAELQSRQPKQDLLVVRKGDVLDFISGAVGDVTESQVAVVAGGRDFQAGRDKIFAIIFADRVSPKEGARVTVKLASGEQLIAKSIAKDAEKWGISLVAGLELKVDTSQLKTLDFGGGRIRYLADVPYTTDGSTSPDPIFPVQWFTCRNAPSGFGVEGKPLRIGESEYLKGLWMCTNAELHFRLNREFTRLQGVGGFELTHVERMPKYNPKLEFVVLADGKELLRRDVKWDDVPQPLDLDISDTRELVIKLVSKSDQPGVLEFFAIGDARLIK